MPRALKKFYEFNDLAGCVVQKKTHVTGTLVGVYNSDQSGMESDSSCTWMTVCEVHSTLVGHSSLKRALSHSSHPEGWCSFCRARDQRYVLDGNPKSFSLDDFLKNNENLHEGDKEYICDLKVGEAMQLGGGAAAEFNIKRVA